MNCNVIDFSLPPIWIFFSAVFFAAAVSRSTRRIKPRDIPEKARALKWSLVCVLLSFAIITAVIALLIAGPERCLEYDTPQYYACVAGVSFLGFRFRKVVGIALLIALLVSSFILLNYLGYWQCSDGPGTIAEFRVLRKNPTEHTLVLYHQGDTQFFNAQVDYATVNIQVLSIHDFYLLTGTGILYQLMGFTCSSDTEGKDLQFEIVTNPFMQADPNETTSSGWYWFSWMNRTIGKLPGIEETKRVSERIRVVPFQKYEVAITEEYSLAIRPVIK